MNQVPFQIKDSTATDIEFLIFRCWKDSDSNLSKPGLWLCFFSELTTSISFFFFFLVCDIFKMVKSLKIKYSTLKPSTTFHQTLYWVNLRYFLLTLRSWLRCRWKEKFSTCSQKPRALWNSTSYSLRVFFWVKYSNFYSETAHMCRGLNHLKWFDLPTSWFTFVEHSSNLLIYNQQIKEGDQRDWPKAVCLISWLCFCLCLLSLFHDLLLHLRLSGLSLPFPLSFTLCSHLPEGSYLWDKPNCHRHALVFISHPYFCLLGPQMNILEERSILMKRSCECAVVHLFCFFLNFRWYLIMEARGTRCTPDRTANLCGFWTESTLWTQHRASSFNGISYASCIFTWLETLNANITAKTLNYTHTHTHTLHLTRCLHRL